MKNYPHRIYSKIQKLAKFIIAGLIGTSPLTGLSQNTDPSEELKKACPHIKDYELQSVPRSTIDHIVDKWRKTYPIKGVISQNSTLPIEIIKDQIEQDIDLTGGKTSVKTRNLVTINSTGGHLFSAFKIAFAITTSKNIDTLCIGQASSAASMLLAVGENSFAYKDCQITTHSPRMISQQTSIITISGAEAIADGLKASREKMKILYNLNAKLGEQCTSYLLRDEDTVLSATQALQIGMIKGVLIENDQMLIRVPAKTVNKLKPSP